MVSTYVKFCDALDLLNNQLHVFHIDPYLHDELDKLMSGPILNPFNLMMRYENEILHLMRICTWAAAIDIAFDNSRLDVSSTSRDLVSVSRRDVLDFGNILIDDVFAQANQMIVRVQDYDQVAQFLREQLDALLISNRAKISSNTLGPIAARMARRFIPLFTRHVAQELCTKLNEVANAVLGARVKPNDDDNNVYSYDQSYTCSNLVPIATFSSLVQLFALFDTTYDEIASVDTNLSNLARKCEATVIFVIKVNTNSTFIEYDDRPLFDSEYVSHVATAPFTGLCDKVLARYVTFRIITSSSSSTNMQNVSKLSIARNSTHSYALIIESVDGYNVRIMTHKLRTINQYYTARIDCNYLFDGQSTRSIQYNSAIIRTLEQHIAQQRVAEVLNKYMGVDDQAEQIELSSTITSRVESFLRQYYSNKLDNNEIDIKTIMRAIIPIKMWEDARNMPMLRARYTILATSIAKRIIDMIDHAKVDTPVNMIAAIIARIDVLELCAENISLYAYLQDSAVK